MITCIKQTSTNWILIAGNSVRSHFYDITQLSSPTGVNSSNTYLTGRCTDMVMVNSSMLWVSSNSPNIHLWDVDRKRRITQRSTGSSNIDSLESLSKNKN